MLSVAYKIEQNVCLTQTHTYGNDEFALANVSRKHFCSFDKRNQSSQMFNVV